MDKSINNKLTEILTLAQLVLFDIILLFFSGGFFCSSCSLGVVAQLSLLIGRIVCVVTTDLLSRHFPFLDISILTMAK